MNSLTALQAFAPRPFTATERAGYLDWSLDFFTDASVTQDPFVDITVQLDVTDAYARYQAAQIEGATFFSFLVWHLMSAMQAHTSFKLRKAGSEWLVLENAPVVVPVAVGGEVRFAEVLLQDPTRQSLPEMIANYRRLLDAARNGERQRMSADTFLAACFIGNLPQLQFSALSLHWRHTPIQCQPCFYFGRRYLQGDRMLIPLAAKLHHACTDPHTFNALIEDFNASFK